MGLDCNTSPPSLPLLCYPSDSDSDRGRYPHQSTSNDPFMFISATQPHSQGHVTNGNGTDDTPLP